MQNPRTICIYELALEVGIDSKDLLDRCKQEGLEFKDSFDKVEPEYLDRVRALAQAFMECKRENRDREYIEAKRKEREVAQAESEIDLYRDFADWVRVKAENRVESSTLPANSLIVHTDEMSWSIKSLWAFLSEKARLLIYGVSKDAATLQATYPREPEFKTSCPKCGFSGKWDGEDCNHCLSSFWLYGPAKTSWERIEWLCKQAGYDCQNILKSLEMARYHEIMDLIQDLSQSHRFVLKSKLHKILLLISDKSYHANRCQSSWSVKLISVLLCWLDQPTLVRKLCKKARIQFTRFNRLSLEDCEKLANLLEEREELKQQNRTRKERGERKREDQEAQEAEKAQEAQKEREERERQWGLEEGRKLEGEERQRERDAGEAYQKYLEQQEADMRRAAEERQRRQDEENERQRRREEEEQRRRPDYGSFP